ncbi:hypothetical protein TRIUR3_07496 [Triticum urartu]|uniref:Uncharacterized protein n=1 Tax=Triticum urartu TaxID=4572 RepID=M7ZTU9_TRIUA|nr:hypothetical protein TRIUR3_07496 [Triticum urartu]
MASGIASMSSSLAVLLLGVLLLSRGGVGNAARHLAEADLSPASMMSYRGMPDIRDLFVPRTC